MANFFEKKDRHIIPNWRSFENTSKLGELNGSKSINLDSSFKPDISDLIDSWNEFNCIGIAGDILGVALVCNQENDKTVRDVSEFVLQNKTIASKAIIDVANKILTPKKDKIELSLDITKPKIFNDKTDLFEIYSKINIYKKKLIHSPYNPIYWIELARYYSILGQDIKAERAIKNGLFLAPENRFVLRSVARFFVHIGDLEMAHDIIRKSKLTKFDPWLLATEISIATLRDRNSIFTKSGIQIVESNNFHPFNISELASSVASVELKNDSINKSRKLFEKSLIHPNDNSLAQAEWASQEEKNLIRINLNEFQMVNSFEAFARENAEQENWQNSIDFSREWFFDQPFSKMAVLFGNEIASRKLKDYNQAGEIAKLGLISHPNDAHLLNNIIYSLCLQNKLEEADKYLKDVRKDDFTSNTFSAICLTATKGLLYFRKGYHDLGRKFYFESMTMAKAENNSYLNSLAFINYVREEILIGNKEMSEAISGLEKIIKANPKNFDMQNDAKEVINLYKQKFQ